MHMSLQNLPPAPEVRELILAHDLPDLGSALTDAFSIFGFFGLQPGPVAHLDVLDQAREPEPAVGQLAGLRDAFLQVVERSVEVLVAEDTPCTEQRRGIVSDKLVTADVEGL